MSQHNQFLLCHCQVLSESSPSLNVPILCPYCLDGSPAVWHYNVKSHLKNQHRVNSEKHKEFWVLTQDEEAVMTDI